MVRLFVFMSLLLKLGYWFMGAISAPEASAPMAYCLTPTLTRPRWAMHYPHVTLR